MNKRESKINPPNITNIGVIFRPVKDLEKARDFYGNTLGLRQVWRASDGATAYTTGSGPIIIVNIKEERIESEAQFNLGTSDISHAYRSMKESGVEVTDIKIVGDTSMFYFKDPDGNTMQIHASHLPDQDIPQYREKTVGLADFN